MLDIGHSLRDKVCQRIIITGGSSGLRRDEQMSDKEFKEQAEALQRAAKKVCASQEAAREFLVRAGIATKSGKLTKAYR